MTRTAAGLGKRGFTIIETIMVLVLVSVLSASAIAWYGQSNSPDRDIAAKTSLLAFAGLQQQNYLQGARLADTTTLTDLDYSRTWQTGGDSTGPQDISVVITGTIAAAAAFSGNGVCWYVRIEMSPSPTSPPALWYTSVLNAGETCTATPVTGFPIPDVTLSNLGTSPLVPLPV